MKQLSLLEYVLLSLVRQQPRSGYDLRKVFAATPMRTFSDSPGAIYPALHRLERRGLVRGKIEERGGLRRRRLLRPTATGLTTLRKWQTKPIVRDDLVSHVDALMVRFAFMDESFGPRSSVRFLRSFARELAAYIPELRTHLIPGMPLSGRLALESGIQGYETLLRWTKTSLAAYHAKSKGDTP
jgi:DNA-binding PadR family transcriptional regulator